MLYLLHILNQNTLKKAAKSEQSNSSNWLKYNITQAFSPQFRFIPL